MTTSTVEEKKPRKRRGPRPRPTPDQGSKEAKRIATAILEVLAGARTPGEAASTLEVSLPRYYGLEAVAIAGLVAACEPRRGGPTMSPEAELAQLKKQNEKLERDCARQQALLRMAQRTVGLPPPPQKEDRKGKRGRGRRPRVRALKAIDAIGSGAHEERTQTAGNEARRPNGRVVAGEETTEGDP